MGQCQITAQWEWKSNQQPFSSGEAQWTEFPPAQNTLIENAFRKKKKEVDLGDYIISLKQMLQRKKDDPHAQRDIRRIHGLNKIEILRAERFFGAEVPRTINKPFGNLSNFLTFLGQQNPDIKKFVALILEIEKSQSMGDLKQHVFPCLIQCFESESKKLPKTKDKTLMLKRELYKDKIQRLFQEELPSLEEFYSRILKVYTMQGFVYEKLNFYLRNEDWVQIRDLLPYLYCLFKAFFHLHLFSELDIHQGIVEDNTTIPVYRGAQFEEAALKFYNPKTSKFFSWNAITSTSTNPDVAQSFMLNNLDPNKVSVLFTIEIPLRLSTTTNASWISVQPFSEYPQESEIVLAPGSVFEMKGVPIKHNNFVEIQLKLVTNPERLIHQGKTLHGALHQEMGDGTSLKLACLEEKDLSETISYLQGNLLLQELEFCLCKFNQRIYDKLCDILKTTSNLNKLVFISPSSTDGSHFSMISEQLKKSLRLKTLEIFERGDFSNESQMTSFACGIGSFRKLTSLNLNFARSINLTDETIRQLCLQGIKHLTFLTCLNLNFERCSLLSDSSIETLCSLGIKRLTLLNVLTLNYTCCERLTNKGLKHLNRQAIRRLASIRSLKINFSQCQKISDIGLPDLCSRGTKRLTSLDLNFMGCSNITDEGLKSLYPKKSTFLEVFNLNVEGCQRITDQGLLYLFPQEIRSPHLLKSISVNLNGCDNITDEGLKNLGSQALKRFEFLKYLSLDLTSCKRLTDKGVSDLFTQGIQRLNSEPRLDISCSECPHITDDFRKFLLKKASHPVSVVEDKKLKLMSFKRELVSESGEISSEIQQKPSKNDGKMKVFDSEKELSNFFIDAFSENNSIFIQSFKNLKIYTEIFSELKPLNKLLIQEIKRFISLQSLHIKFAKNDLITSSWLNDFCSQRINNLTSLTFDFSGYNKISDEWLTILNFQNLQHLKSLCLIFAGCHRITDLGIKNLHLKQLKSLTSLTLSFERCDQITDQGLSHLCFEEIQKLATLTSLNLNYSNCLRITDEGLNATCSQGIKHLHSLKLLSLNFDSCPEITNATCQNFRKVLKYFGFRHSQ